MTLAISRRTVLSRSTACWSVASDSTLFIVEQVANRDAGELSSERGCAGALGDFVTQNRQDRDHFRKRLAGLLRRGRFRQPVPRPHDLVVPQQKLVFK